MASPNQIKSQVLYQLSYREKIQTYDLQGINLEYHNANQSKDEPVETCYYATGILRAVQVPPRRWRHPHGTRTFRWLVLERDGPLMSWGVACRTVPPKRHRRQ
jgi:hypothetical protein